MKNSLLISITFSLIALQSEALLSKNLRYYEVLHADDLKHHIVKRGLQESSHPLNKIKEVTFSALGRQFRLILAPKKSVLHSKFKAYTIDGEGKETSIHLDHDNFYGGRVFGEMNSEANLHIDQDGVLTGAIHLPDETYHIELPLWGGCHLNAARNTWVESSDNNFKWMALVMIGSTTSRDSTRIIIVHCNMGKDHSTRWQILDFWKV